MGIHVACVGDSITQGSGTSSAAAAYPSVLGTLLGAGWEVENDGRSGTTLMTSGDFPYRNTVQFTASTAWTTSGADVVIQLGTNDSKPANWSDKATFLGDCKALVAHYRTAANGNARVWINLPPPATSGACCKIDGTVIANEIVPLLKTCAADTGASTIDVHSAFAGHLDWLTDGVHPNDQGAALIAQTVHDALVRTPSVSLDVDASSSSAPVNVTLSATPSAAYGKVEKVRFYDGTNVVSELTSGPWTFTLASVGEGKHVYRAEAVETAGRAASSTSTAVTVEGTAVVVTPNVPPVSGGAGSNGESTTPGATTSPGTTPGESAAADSASAADPAAAEDGCSVSTGGVGSDALATFVIVAFALQRLMRVRAA
jgi:acyl-CoA thioesterase I